MCDVLLTGPPRLLCRCFVDFKPRRMDAESCMILNNLSEMVVRELEKDVYLSQQRQQAQQLQQLNVGLLRAMDSFREAVMVVDTSGRDGWTVEHINSSVTSETGEADLPGLPPAMCSILQHAWGPRSLLCQSSAPAALAPARQLSKAASCSPRWVSACSMSTSGCGISRTGDGST